MSTWFSHLSMNPTMFGLDLRPFLEKECYEDNNSPEGYGYYYTDNHSQEYLMPTMVAILSYMAKNKFEDLGNGYDYNYQHFWNAGLSYITSFYKHPEFVNEDFFKNKYEILDEKLIFDNYNRIINFHVFVATNAEKEALIKLLLSFYAYGIDKYRFKERTDIKLATKSTVRNFLDNFIVVKDKFDELAAMINVHY